MTTTHRGGFRLLVFTAEPMVEGYGSATALRTFIRAAVTYTNWQLTLVVPQVSPDVPSHPSERVRILAIPMSSRMNRRAQLLRYVLCARAEVVALANPPPDAIISWQPMPAGLAGAAVARSCRAPHVVRTCGPELARSWSPFPAATSALMPLTRRLLARADAVVVKSDVEHMLVESIAKVPVHRIANAVDREFLSPTRARREDETLLLTVCQLEAHKGVATLLAALATVRGLRCRLTVVGDGSQRDHLQRAAAASGVRVEFLGRVPHSELPAVYAKHDAFVLASKLEGCSNAVLEAMAAGLPVIGNRSALSDLVEDGVMGVLAGSADEHGFAAALKQFLGPQTDREAMRQAARQRAAAHSPERLVADYGRLLDALGKTERPPKKLTV